MWRIVLCLTCFIVASHPAQADEGKEYPLTLKLLETKRTSLTASSSRVETNCQAVPGTENTNCDSRQVGGGTRVEFTSTVEASDGNTYEIKCATGRLGAMAEGAAEASAAYSGTTFYSGCPVRPGTYRARWHKGRLAILIINSKGKSKEWVFAILSAKPTADVQRENVPPQGTLTSLKVISTPIGGSIELDGSYTGNTPSTLLVPPGEHTVKVEKLGYRPWERKIKTLGGDVTVEADLEPEKPQ